MGLKLTSAYLADFANKQTNKVSPIVELRMIKEIPTGLRKHQIEINN